MKDDSEIILEPERYELAVPCPHPSPIGWEKVPEGRMTVPRRDFIKLLTGGLVVLLYVDGAIAQESGGRRRGGAGAGQRQPKELAAWLHIGEDGKVTVFTGKVEVGQNARTSLTQAVAEELPVPVEWIHLVMGDTDLTPYDAGTFGSQSTPSMVPQLRKVAATARESLIDLAADHFKADRQHLVAAGGNVTYRTENKSVSFGELTKGKEIAKSISSDAPMTAPADWKVMGTSKAKVDGEVFVTGRHQYASDLRLPDMLYGKVLRPPSFGATRISVDSKGAEALPGVKVIRDGEFIGVAAPTQALANQALSALSAEWKTSAQPSGKELFELLKKSAADRGGRSGSLHQAGSIEQGLALAEHKLQQVYTVAYIAHVPLEPRAAMAQWQEDKLTVWTGTQRPFGVRTELAQALGIPEAQVRVIMPDTGSGYGGKHTGEAALEAARLARGAHQPVKLVWTRQEEFTWAYFRPAGVIEISSGVQKDGTVTAWEFHNHNSGTSGIRPVYEFPNQSIHFHNANSPLRQGSYRALAATANHFARETHMDELAAMAGIEPLAFRLQNLKEARLQNVLKAAAEAFGWAKSKPASGHGFGIAGGFEKGSYVATCAEVVVEKNREVRLLRVVEAFECGAVINPDHLTNQIQGMIMMGLGGALFESVEFDNGKILNARLARYRVPRFSDLPKIDVVLVNRKDLPSVGAGETPIVGIAPAVGNAIFNATGVRLRSLPLAPDGLPA